MPHSAKWDSAVLSVKQFDLSEERSTTADSVINSKTLCKEQISAHA